MDWNGPLLLIVVFTDAVLLWRSLRAGGRLLRGWTFVAAGLLVLCGIAWLWAKPQSGYIAIVAWVIFALLPSFLWAQAQRTSPARRGMQVWLTRLAAIFHPLDGWPQQARILGAQWLAERGDRQAAAVMFEKLAPKPGRTGLVASALGMALDARWEELYAWLSVNVTDASLTSDPTLLLLYLRALGETGRLEEMIQAWQRFAWRLHSQRVTRELALRMLLALCGRPEAVARLAPPRNAAPAEHQFEFWLATATAAAGDAANANPVFLQLQRHDPALSAQARYRLEHPPRPASTLQPDAQQLLDWIAQQSHQTAASEPRRTAVPWMTWTLIALNVLVFLVEIFSGGSQNDDTLYKLGAASDLALQSAHEWWRFLACNFLHYGIPHIAFNMFALLVLGPFVERSMGRGRYLIVYLLSGIGAAAGVALLQFYHLREEGFLVGASGAIMGLVGATGAILLRQWLRHRAGDVRQRLINVIWIVVLQIGFDSMVKEVSGSDHLIGLSLGFIIAWLLGYAARRQRGPGFQVIRVSD